MATWTTLIALLSIHLATNYAAVQAVSMRCLNRQRANILFSSILEHGEILSPSDVSKRERVFERDGVLRWADDEILGHCRIGVTLNVLLGRFGRPHPLTGSVDLHASLMSALLDTFADEAYILWPGYAEKDSLIVLKAGCSPIDQLKAWAHALLLAKTVRGEGSKSKPADDDASLFKDRLAEIRRTSEHTRVLFTEHVQVLKNKGWDLDVVALETRAGTRVWIDTEKR